MREFIIANKTEDFIIDTGIVNIKKRKGIITYYVRSNKYNKEELEYLYNLESTKDLYLIRKVEKGIFKEKIRDLSITKSDRKKNSIYTLRIIL